MTAIQKFMQDHYSDAKLAELLAHAQDGKLSFLSCCCFVGSSTANHALRACKGPFMVMSGDDCDHLITARMLPGARAAEEEFYDLGGGGLTYEWNDEQRRAKLIPMILEEMERRGKLRGTPAPVEELALVY